MPEISIAFRADGGGATGYGHVMRCITIGAELVRRGMQSSLVAAELDPFLRQRANRLGLAVSTVRGTAGTLDDADELIGRGDDLIVVDGYSFGIDYYRRLEGAGMKYGVIDDIGFAAACAARFIVNPNLHATSTLYSAVEASRLFLGIQYVPVRQEILELRSAVPHIGDVDPTLLVAIGGTDVLRLGPTVATQLLERFAGRVIVTGPYFIPGAEQCAPDIATALSQAAVTVIGAGTTLWEACHLGTPSISLIVADNQAPSAMLAAQRGATLALDCRNGLDLPGLLRLLEALVSAPSQRALQRERGRALVDGLGTVRIADLISKVAPE